MKFQSYLKAKGLIDSSCGSIFFDLTAIIYKLLGGLVFVENISWREEIKFHDLRAYI